VRDRPARGCGNQRPSLDHRAGLGAIPPAEIAQHRGLRRGRALFGRHACHSKSKSRSETGTRLRGPSGHAAGPGTRTGPFLNHTNGRDQKRPDRGETRTGPFFNHSDGWVIWRPFPTPLTPYTEDPRTVTGSSIRSISSPTRPPPTREAAGAAPGRDRSGG